MIAEKILAYRVDEKVWENSADRIRSSGVADMIAGWHQLSACGAGGRPPACRFSLLAVFTGGLVLARIGRVPSLAEIYRVLVTLSPQQLAVVGMADQQPAASSYRGFAAWVTRQLEVLDAGVDLPARRETNREFSARLAARSPQRQQASDVAAGRLHQVVNGLIQASIDQWVPAGYQGDVVADESIIDLARAGDGLGTRADKSRAAAYAGRFYVRDRRVTPSTQVSAGEIKKAAVGLGVTAVMRVGPPRDLHRVAPVITGVAIHPPTSGSVAGLVSALDAHQWCAPSRGRRARWPYLTVDMGYNNKKGFTRALVDLGYSPVVRYPEHWRTVQPCADSSAGPVQIAGTMYCPAAAMMPEAGRVVRRTAGMLERGDFDRHDSLLRRLLPLMMGTNSRPTVRHARVGRPRAGQAPDEVVTQDFVCPAVQGRVVCPLKPGSQQRAGLDAPRVQPRWSADRYVCCSQSQVRVALTDGQLRMAQWGLPAGSWEHALYYEAARSLTEQRFSLLKSHHLSGFSDLTWTPRREPMIGIIIALQVMETNRVIQAAWSRHRGQVDSWRTRWRQLREFMGRDPVTIPART